MRENKDQLPDEEEENKEQVSCKEIEESNPADNVERPLDPVCATNKPNAVNASKENAKKALRDLVKEHKTALIAAIKCEGPCKNKKRVCAKPRKKDIKATDRKIEIRVVQLNDAQKEKLDLKPSPGNKDWWGATAVISFNMTGKCRCINKKKKKKKKK